MRLLKEEIIGLDDEMECEYEIGSQCSCIAELPIYTKGIQNGDCLYSSKI